MNNSEELRAGSGDALPLPPRMGDLGGASSAEYSGAMRAGLIAETAAALRVGAASASADTDTLDAWLAMDDVAQSVRRWFGSVLKTERRWILLAIDRDIAEIDQLLSVQVDAILHAEPFQALEARWRGLRFLTEAGSHSPLAKIRMLAVSWPEVVRDMERAADFDRSQLFAKIYTEEFGMLGGQPFGLLVGDYYVQHRASAEHSTDDIAALKCLAMIAAASFAPLIMGASPKLFQLESFGALGRPLDLRAVFRGLEYDRWQAMRTMEETRFVGLVLPRVLARLPYRLDPLRRDGFRYQEAIERSGGADFLWGNASLAFGAVVLRAFANFGWFADIRGAARDELRGGLVTDLPLISFTSDAPGVAVKPSMEAVLSDTQEKDLADLGFIALQKIPFTEYSVFYANQSIHLPPRYDRPSANVNARLSSMLQYVLCVSRFAHYVKLLARGYIGTAKTADEVEAALSMWLRNYCVGSEDASQQQKARYPLREASVEVRELPGKSGAYSCVLFLRPHFQLDDVATGFRLVTQLSATAAAA